MSKPKLKAMKTVEELNAVPTDEPVLVQLEPAATSAANDDEPVNDAAPKAAEKTDDAGTDAGIDQLRNELAAAQKAREASDAQIIKEREDRQRAEQAAADAARKVRLAESHSLDTEEQAIGAGLSGAQAERDAAKAAVRSAFEAGDADKLAEAQERLGRVAADIREYERAQAALADRKAEAARQPEPQQSRPSDINSLIDQMNLLPAERDWLKAHPESLMDRSRNVELDAAYIKATRKGLARGTPAYFQFIEKEMGYVDDNANAGADQNNRDDSDIVSAPVAREARSSSGAPTGNRVVLSPEQREFARTMGLTDIQYATQVLALRRDKSENPEKYAAR